MHAEIIEKEKQKQEKGTKKEFCDQIIANKKNQPTLPCIVT